MAASLLAAVGPASAATETTQPRPLFDGRSLAGWETSGSGVWKVADGAIVGSGAGDGFLLSAGQYGDFRLRVEFWVDSTTNSGVFVRCRDRGRIHPDTCYELNIWDEHPQQEARTGAIVFLAMPPLARVDTVGKWNTMEVTARGEQLEVSVNGVVTARLADADPTPGYIALQHWGEGTVRFRAVELAPL